MRKYFARRSGFIAVGMIGLNVVVLCIIGSSCSSSWLAASHLKQIAESDEQQIVYSETSDTNAPAVDLVTPEPNEPNESPDSSGPTEGDFAADEPTPVEPNEPTVIDEPLEPNELSESVEPNEPVALDESIEPNEVSDAPEPIEDTASEKSPQNIEPNEPESSADPNEPAIVEAVVEQQEPEESPVVDETVEELEVEQSQESAAVNEPEIISAAVFEPNELTTESESAKEPVIEQVTQPAESDEPNEPAVTENETIAEQDESVEESIPVSAGESTTEAPRHEVNRNVWAILSALILEPNEPNELTDEPEQIEEPDELPSEPDSAIREEPDESDTAVEEPKEVETEPETQPESTSAKTTEIKPPVKAADESAEAAETNGSGLVSNVFFDTDLRQALNDIATQTGVVIVPDESVMGLVTCTLDNVPLEKALNIVLAGTSYVIKKTPDYYMICSADPKSALFPIVSETRLIKLNNIKANTAVGLLSSGFRDYVQANNDDNTVSITARPALMGRIMSDLIMFDRPARHVMLDARIVVMDSGDLLNLGLQWDWPGVSAGAYSNSELHGGQRGSSSGPRWPWGIQVGYTTGKEFTNSLLLTLNLLSENDEATVVASPHVMAQDGKEAQIKVVTEEYFKITEESSYYTRFELETIETGTILTITPRIGDNNEITLEMITEVSDVIARGEDNLPIVTRRSTKNTVRIEDGGTAAVAGLMDTRKRIQKTKAPGLGDIPILGLFFNNTNKSESTRQVAVFITARLMSEKGKLGQESTGYLTPIQPVGEEFKIVLQKAISVLDKEK